MARSAPFPNVLAIPGMNPGVFVMGGGGNGGGSGAGGGKGNGKGGSGRGNNGGKDANGGGKHADSNQPCGGGCKGPHPLASRGDPVDVLSGRVSTVPVADFVLSGPLPLSFMRVYDSGAAGRDVGFGFGWTNPLAWEIEVRRREVVLWDEEGLRWSFPAMDDRAEIIGPRGWALRRSGARYELDTGDDLFRVFEALPEGELAVLCEVRDRNGNTLTIERDGRSLRRLRDSAGRTIAVERTADGHVASLVAVLPAEENRRARLVSYRYDAQGNLAAVTDADGFEARFTYDSDHRLTSATNRCGVTFHYRYDGSRRCIETWGNFEDREDPSLVRPTTLGDGTTKPKGVHHYRFDYGEDGYTEVIGGRAVERFMGSPGGRIDKSVHGGAVVTREYDEGGHLAAFVDGLGAMTRIERDSRGRWLRKVDPLGRVTEWRRDTAGRIVEEVDPAGGVRRTAYDERGNVIELIEPDGAVTSHTYDARGLMVTWTEPNGATSRATYDEAGNWVAVMLPSGATWRRTFDGLGRKLSETDPAGGTKRFRYSARGDLLGVQDEAGSVTTYTYDGEGHVTSETDPVGRRSEYSYGAGGKLHTLKQPGGAVFSIRYNLDGSIAEAINEIGERYALSWDSRGNLIEERAFDGRVIAYHYDLADRVTRAVHEPSDMVVLLSYDDAGQLVRRELPDGEVETYDYDPLGRVVFAANRETSCRFERDAAGRVVREEQSIEGSAVTVETSYAKTGEPVVRRTSLGHLEHLRWSADGALAAREVSGGVVALAVRDALGREQARTLSGGGAIQTAYDAAGRLAGTRVLSPAGVTVELRNQHHAEGALALSWDSRKGSVRYERDAAGRLARVTHQSGAAQAFSYDAASNLFEEGDGRIYEAGGRLVRHRETSFRYDDDGRLIEKARPEHEAPERYEWSDTGRLRAVITPEGERISFVYDCFGRRLLKRTSRGAVRFVWDADDLIHEVRAAADGAPAVRTYLFEPGQWTPSAHRDGPSEGTARGDGWVHYATDAIGTPLLLVDDAGNVVADAERSAWGMSRGGLATPIGFPGQYLDEETGLAYHRFRYYDSETGRFVSPDPLGLEGGADLYGYPPDPTRWDDPFGLRFPDPVKRDTLADNRARNGGMVVCSNSNCGDVCIQPQKSMKGVTLATRPEMLKEWQMDHIKPSSKGGEDIRENCQVLCRRCNRDKSDKW